MARAVSASTIHLPVGRAGAALLAALCALVLSACSTTGGASSVGDAEDDGIVQVTTTTNFITDTVKTIGGDRVEVQGLMGAGVDPHTYKASAGDVDKLRSAELAVYNGLTLEGRMGDVFEGVRDGGVPTLAIGEQLPEDRRLGTEASQTATLGEFDPHIWFDPERWVVAGEAIAAELSELDPEGADSYAANLAAFRDTLDELDADVQRQISSIPEKRRVLVTSHDAFRYYGDAFGMEVVSIQGISTQSEATTADIERVTDAIVERELPTVFVESSVSRQTIDAVVDAARERGQQVNVGPELYSDAAGQAGTEEGTYPGMVRANTADLVKGLR